MPKRRVEDLKANQFNAKLFSASLSEESIQTLADSIREEGLNYPIRIMGDGTIVDGERRWRAVQVLGWDLVAVRITEDYSPSDLLDQVIDSATSTRQMNLEEKARIYESLVEQLKVDSGLAWGGSKKRKSEDGGKPSVVEIQERARSLAGFSSVSIAKRASAVFAKGSQDLKEQTLAGSLTISAAYGLLSGSRPKTTDSGKSPKEEDTEKNSGDKIDKLLEKITKILKKSEPDALRELIVAHIRPWLTTVKNLKDSRSKTPPSPDEEP